MQNPKATQTTFMFKRCMTTSKQKKLLGAPLAMLFIESILIKHRLKNRIYKNLLPLTGYRDMSEARTPPGLVAFDITKLQFLFALSFCSLHPRDPYSCLCGARFLMAASWSLKTPHGWSTMFLEIWPYTFHMPFFEHWKGFDNLTQQCE